MAQDIIDGRIEPDPKVAVDVQEMYEKLYAHRAEFKDFPFIEERYAPRNKERVQTVQRSHFWQARLSRGAAQKGVQ
jgi:hypothetical protein